ncbi:hypothetical protein VTO7225_02055 [Vibrio toranzoniae]|jgi:hypothetical protein|nr:hypothetical protein VTO7225_02055 [Vibrio toranzoniae]
MAVKHWAKRNINLAWNPPLASAVIFHILHPIETFTTL